MGRGVGGAGQDERRPGRVAKQDKQWGGTSGKGPATGWTQGMEEREPDAGSVDLSSTVALLPALLLGSSVDIGSAPPQQHHPKKK